MTLTVLIFIPPNTIVSPQAVMGDMLEEVKNAPLPILHHMIDIWTDKASGRKFLGVHLFHVTANFELKETLLSVSV